MFEIILVGDRRILIKGVASLFYQDGFPLSISIEELSNRGVEVSLYHIADQCWNNGWSPKTILRKFREECDIDINKSMSGIDWEKLEYFCECIEQPKRANGGYEESREIIFQYLFGMSSDDVTIDSYPAQWAISAISKITKDNEK